MKIEIKTVVTANYKKVFKKFDKDLFLALKPPLLPLSLTRFDGSYKGDEVHITLGKGALSQDWHALIVEQVTTDDEIYFIDEGIKLPFFLKYWQHRHRMINLNDKETMIIDDITFKSPFILFDYLLYPMLYLQFWVRKPVYKRYF